MSRITGYSLTMPFAPRMSRAFRQEDLLGPHRARVLPLPAAPGEERHLALDEASHARPRHALLLAEELVQPVVVDLAHAHRDPLAARAVARPQAGSYKVTSHSITRCISVHLETLKVFCDVVETRSFSVAASQNFVTQSAVSQQIRSLEERYGRRLLERTRGNVQLTPAGEILYQVSKEIVQRYQDMEARLQALSKIVAGTVRVATVHSIGLYELSAQIKRYLKAYPQVHLHLAYSRSSRIYEDVLKGNVDVGVVAYPSRRPGVTVLPFRNDRLVLACPPHHPLAGHRRVSIRKLNGEPLVGYERDQPTRKETDRLLRRYGVEVRYVMELDNIETIKRVVEIGTGIAILPEPAVRSEVRSKTLATVQLSDEVFLRPLGIIHRQGKHFSPAAEKFIEFLRAE